MNASYYRLYDLLVKSPFAFTNVEKVAIHDANESKEPVVRISYGEVPSPGLIEPLENGPFHQQNAHEFWLNIPPIARFLVLDGQQIIIDPTEKVDTETLQTWVVNVCFEKLLRQRQLFVMPGYSLRLGNSGIAFSNSPGSNQALLLLELFKRGHVFLSGNQVAVNQEGAILPETAQLEIWPEMASRLGFDVSTFRSLRPGVKKCILPLGQQFYRKVSPLKAIYHIQQQKQTSCYFLKMDDSQKLYSLLRQTGGPQVLTHSEENKIFRQQYADLAKKMDIITIHLPATGLKLTHLADIIEQDFAERGYSHATA